MEKVSNYEGHVFGNLLIRLDLGMMLNKSKTRNARMVLAECLNCSKGIGVYRLSNLRTKNTKSCGCLQRELLIKRSTKHGKYYAVEYSVWKAMIKRCGNPTDKNYKNYGGRGITVCQSWKESFANFLQDMGSRLQDSQIDRIDNNKGYYPENCRWATKSENAFNKRIQKNNKSGKTGVCWSKSKKRWVAQITKNNHVHYIGMFKNLDEAVQARKNAELEFFGFSKD